MSTAFDAIAEPARRRILDQLLEGPRAVGELAEGAGLSQPNTSRHLRVLRESGVVAVRPEGQRRLYELQPEGLVELFGWAAPYLRLWRGSLDRLEQHLERNPD